MDLAGRKEGGMQIYPNPVDENLTIRLDEVYAGDHCAVYAIHGVLVHASAIGETVSQLNVTGLARGVYFLEVRNGSSLFREKFVKY